ncbi:MAG: ribonuclease [Ruminococcaceae bacterium]|nr:ribonuclease [Oscillospiraceae bacterium]
MKRILSLLIAIFTLLSLLAVTFTSCTAKDAEKLIDDALDVALDYLGDNSTGATSEESGDITKILDENGTYDDKERVALYIHLYGKLPSNYITKEKAEELGWSGGSVERYAKGKCIGGSRFGNYEGLLPKKSGRTYYECDIDTLGESSRGAKRIVYSNDGLIYYTDDHYETFELLYGEE